MIAFENLSLRRGKRLLFAGASFKLHAGDRVGITGANGTGKSSLFALIRGLLEEDAGALRLSEGCRIAHVAQETPAIDTPAIDYVMQGDAELWQLLQQLHAAEAAHDGHAVAALHEQMEHIDGYAARARAARLMHGLGFQALQEETPVASFSGGWRMRLNLAQALMCRSDLLLLDEPTNHLDLDAVIWLENWLKSYRGALMLISHDRDFLDSCINAIAHLEQESITLYTGNYSDFEIARAEKLAQQQAAHAKQEREIAHISSFIDRFRAKASKAKQAQSRIKALERMQRIAPAHVDSPFSFAFRHPGQVPNPLLRLQKVNAGYGDQTILKQLSLGLFPGDRIGLLGPNGAGKSTLIKLLAGDLAAQGGTREVAQSLRIGYFAQHQLEQLHGELTPLQHLQMLDPDAGERDLRNYLGGFAFVGDMATEPVAPLSGGEKARLVLAMLVYQQPNLLLLDEPTNHLDLEMRLALTMAIESFEGALVLVSHDRHLLRTTCDTLLLVCDGKAEVFDGDLDDYAAWLASRRGDSNRALNLSATGQVAPKVDQKERKRLEAERRKQLQPLRNKLKDVEKQLEALNQRKETINLELADPAIYEDAQKSHLKNLTIELSELNLNIEKAEESWMSLSETLENG